MLNHGPPKGRQTTIYIYIHTYSKTMEGLPFLASEEKKKRRKKQKKKLNSMEARFFSPFNPMLRKDAARQRRKMQERSAAEVWAIEEERALQPLDAKRTPDRLDRGKRGLGTLVFFVHLYIYMYIYKHYCHYWFWFFRLHSYWPNLLLCCCFFWGGGGGGTVLVGNHTRGCEVEF